MADSYIHDSSVQDLRNKIDPIKFCMMTTVNENLMLSSRPMTKQSLDDEGNLWFFTSDNCQLAHDLSVYPNLNISFVDPAQEIYVSITGSAALVKEQQKIEQLWNSMTAVWFPIDDPHLALIKVSIQCAEYWDSSTNKMMQFFSMAKMVVNDRQGKYAGEHVKLAF